MKKLFTMVLAAGSFVAVSAQPGVSKNNNKYDEHGRNDKYKNGSNKQNEQVKNNAYWYAIKQKDARIASIERAYDKKIAAVKYRRFINAYSKAKMISNLKNEKAREIRKVELEFLQEVNHRPDYGYSKNDRRG